MLCAAQIDQVYAADFSERNFDGLGEAAPQDPLSYVRGWSTHTNELLSAVAELQSHPRRSRIDAVAAHRNSPTMIREPGLAKLFGDSHCTRAMKLDEIVELIGVEMADCSEAAS